MNFLAADASDAMSRWTPAAVLLILIFVKELIQWIMAKQAAARKERREEAAEIRREEREDRAAEVLRGELKGAAKVVAGQVDEVKESLISSNTVHGTKLDQIHALANGQTELQMKLIKELFRWKADQTKERGDIEAADRAEAAYRDHVAARVVAEAKAAKG